MVLAAGLGTRMRPLTDTMPKPMVPVAGKPLLDHVLDRLAEADVATAVVNVHYLPDQIVQHVKGRARPHVVISDERDTVLGTGGGVVKARVTAKGGVTGLDIDPSLLDPAQKEVVEDLILAAIRDGQMRGNERAQTEMARIAEEMGLPPGMSLPG